MRRLPLLMIATLFTSVCAVAHASPAGVSAPPPALLESLLEKFHKTRDQLGNTRHVALLNYRQPSWEPRFYVIDTASRKVVQRYVVAHGRGSDPDHDGIADRFSDKPESHMSSLGFYVTGKTYISPSDGHGLSLRLNGLSPTNRNALNRNIVIHANWYMEPDFLKQHRKPGRSYGCLVFAPEDRNQIVDSLKGGALLYAAY